MTPLEWLASDRFTAVKDGNKDFCPSMAFDILIQDGRYAALATALGQDVEPADANQVEHIRDWLLRQPACYAAMSPPPAQLPPPI